MSYLYHISRVIFGGWWLYSGAMPFIDPAWQPLGQEPAAITFSQALIASGLMKGIKVIEIVFGLLILANRAMPLAVMVITPINVVICYWNFVLDEGVIEYVFGALTILFNAVFAWVWRGYFWSMMPWKGTPDYSAILFPRKPR